jgi:hypothetical protein
MRARHNLPTVSENRVGQRPYAAPRSGFSDPAAARTCTCLTPRAASVDHCTHLTDQDIEMLPDRRPWRRCCPRVTLSTRQPRAPGRALMDVGARVALASNCNPGSSYTSSMNLVVALGVLTCGLSAAEAVHAATAGGAAPLPLTGGHHPGGLGLVERAVLAEHIEPPHVRGHRVQHRPADQVDVPVGR